MHHKLAVDGVDPKPNEMPEGVSVKSPVNDDDDFFLDVGVVVVIVNNLSFVSLRSSAMRRSMLSRPSRLDVERGGRPDVRV